MCMSKPKVPKPQPVIERQAYRSPVPRESLGSDDADRRRRLMGVETGAGGVTGAASTTGRVQFGGDTPMNPTIGGGGGSPIAVSPAAAAIAAATPAPVRGATTPGTAAPKKRASFGGPGGMWSMIAAAQSR
jgi:hypothetical protein